jgi:uncharacterized protein (UPF0335 family)
MDSTAVARLVSIVERIERLMEEQKALANDVKDVKAEAKSAGYSVPVIMKMIKLRAQDPADRQEIETLEKLYRQALGIGD